LAAVAVVASDTYFALANGACVGKFHRF